MNRAVLIGLLAAGVIVGSPQLFAQAEWVHQRDSLLGALAHSKPDTNRVWLLERLGETYAGPQSDSTLYYAEAYNQLSRQLNYHAGIVSSVLMKAWFLGYHELKTDSGIAMDMEAIRLAKQANLKILLGQACNNVANLYKERKEDYLSAVGYYLKALDIFESIPDSGLMARTYCNIGLAYQALNEYQNAYRYSLQGLEMYRSMHLVDAGSSGILGLSSALVAMKRYDTALVVLSEGRVLADKLFDLNLRQVVLVHQIDIYTKTRRLDQLKYASDELVHLSESLKTDGRYEAWGGLSDYYFYKHDYKNASIFNDSLVNQTKNDSVLSLLSDAYERKAKIGLAEGRLPLYDRYTELHDSITDLLLSDKILKNTQELEAKYTLDKEQAQINRLNDEKKISDLTLRQHLWAIWALSGALVIFAVFGFLFYSNSQQKKKLFLSESALQQQKIIELEKERQLLATRSVLIGQDEERKRLAKDLHDGLGGILSVAKYSFSNMKQNLIISAENAQAFDKSMGYLDRSIQELRRVAHNMMPEALMEFGLDTALKDYCNSVTNSGVMIITYQSFDLSDHSVPPTSASVIYRIVQELINNILKHAAATTAAVQLVKRSDVLNITVEDNGKGFDLESLTTSTGIGFLNLQNRVSYLLGTIDVQSAPGKGTFVNIEIPVTAAV